MKGLRSNPDVAVACHFQIFLEKNENNSARTAIESKVILAESARYDFSSDIASCTFNKKHSSIRHQVLC